MAFAIPNLTDLERESLFHVPEGVSIRYDNI